MKQYHGRKNDMHRNFGIDPRPVYEPPPLPPRRFPFARLAVGAIAIGVAAGIIHVLLRGN